VGAAAEVVDCELVDECEPLGLEFVGLVETGVFVAEVGEEVALHGFEYDAVGLQQVVFDELQEELVDLFGPVGIVVGVAVGEVVGGRTGGGRGVLGLFVVGDYAGVDFVVYFALLGGGVQEGVDQGEGEFLEVLFLYFALEALLHELALQFQLDVHKHVAHHE
jgi:hypothetical protein